MNKNEAQARMEALLESIAGLREERDRLRSSESMPDVVRAQAVDAKLGRKEERLAELERKYPTAAQELNR